MTVWTEFAHVWWSWIAPLSVHVVVVFLSVLALDWALPKRTWPQLRTALWAVVLLRLVLPPGWARASASTWALADSVGWAGIERLAVVFSGGIPLWVWLAVSLWFCGLAALASFGCLRFVRAQRHWHRTTEPANEALLHLAASTASRVGLRRTPNLRVGDSLLSPFVTGVLRPTVYLPRVLTRGHSEHLEHALLHEFSHIRRLDPLLSTATLGIALLYWFHPVVWWTLRRLGELREQSCDLAVAKILGPQAPRYRNTLLWCAAHAAGEAYPASLGILGARSSLLARLRLLDGYARERSPLRRSVTAIAVVLMLAFVLPVAKSAEQKATAVAEWIDKPPGSLRLRYMVMKRLNEQQLRAQQALQEQE